MKNIWDEEAKLLEKIQGMRWRAHDLRDSLKNLCVLHPYDRRLKLIMRQVNELPFHTPLSSEWDQHSSAIESLEVRFDEEASRLAQLLNTTQLLDVAPTQPEGETKIERDERWRREVEDTKGTGWEIRIVRKIAAREGVPVPTIRTAIERARKLLVSQVGKIPQTKAGPFDAVLKPKRPPSK